MSLPTPDREKYLKLAREHGLNVALTALHDEMNSIEWDSFEGIKGWQPDAWNGLKDYREFSLELWDLRHDLPSSWNKKA